MLYQSPMPKSHNYIQCLFITYTAPLFVNRGRASSSLFTELLVPQMLQNFTIVLSSYSSRYVEIHRRNYSPMQVEVVKHMGMYLDMVPTKSALVVHWMLDIHESTFRKLLRT